MSEKITNEVLLERLDNLIGANTEDHKKLLEQTTRTNGRVTALEAWKNIATGVVIISQMIVVPILLYILYLHIKP